jgi:hypothetical protein
VTHFFLLALASAFYPLLLATAVVMLDRQRPVPLLAGFLAGGVIVSVGVGIALLQIIDTTGVLGGHERRTVGPWADIVLGALAVAIGALLASGRPLRPRRRRETAAPDPPVPAKEPLLRRILAGDSAGLAFLAGMLLNLPSVYYLAALSYLGQEYGPSARAYGLIVAFNVIQFGLIEVPLICFLAAPDATRRRVEAFNHTMAGRWRTIAAVVALAAGTYLMLHGVTRLVT